MKTNKTEKSFIPYRLCNQIMSDVLDFVVKFNASDLTKSTWPQWALYLFFVETTKKELPYKIRID